MNNIHCRAAKDDLMIFETLIVDNSAVFRESLKGLLFRHFPAMSVVEAENGAEAWQRLDESQPQLVFLDIRLREEDGLDLVWRIRLSYPDVVVAVITGHDGHEYREAAYSRGADCYVPKNSVTSSDITCLIESIRSGQPPKWALGIEYLNPLSPAHAWE